MLNETGRFAEAIRIIDSLAADKLSHDDGQNATIWNLRGVALQGLGDYENARRSYETSIRILRGDAQQKDELATVLDNFGSLEAVEGQLQESKSLRLHAVELFRSTKNHAGAARTYTNLALLATSLKKKKDARFFIEEASREESMITQESLLDMASIESARALVAEKNGHHADAESAVNHAIELWTQQSGPDSYPVGLCYGVRGELFRNQHMYTRALDDLRHCLELLRQNGAGASREYAANEMLFARLLRSAGMNALAHDAESDAKMRLNSLNRRDCNQCSISAEGFR